MGNKKILPVMAGICVLSLAVMIWALAFSGKEEKAEFVPPPFEKEAASGVPEVPEELGWGELDAKAFKVSVCGVVCAEAESADVWLTNPQSNDVWLKLRMLDADGKILGETGLLRPGEYVRAIRMNRETEAGEKITLKIMSYEPETFYSEGAAVLNTTIR